jgi:predicted dehydrogenase
MIEACLVGLTGYAQTHLGWIRENQAKGRMRLRSITILPSEQEREADAVASLIEEGVKIFSSTASMFEEGRGQLQLCFLPTSIASHKTLTLEALEAGCHVLVEKPLAGSSAEAREIMDARDRYERMVVVGFQDLSRRDIHVIKAGLQEGHWGNLESINFTAVWPRHHTYYQRNDWAGKLQHRGLTINDSPANNATAHYLNMGLFVAGDQPNLSAEVASVDGDLYRCREIESFDTMSVRFKLNTGLHLRYSVSHSSSHQLPEELSFRTDEGELKVSSRSILWHPRMGAVEDLTVDNVNDGRRHMVDSLLDHIENGSSTWPHCSLEIADSHVKAIEKMHEQLTIQTVDEESVIQSDNITCLQGLDHAMDLARKEGLTFRELDLSFT